MSITPVGGWNGQLQQNQPQEGQLLPRTSDTCPSCYGTEWKAASLLYAEGLSISGSQTRGAFVAGGRAHGVNGAAIGGFQGRTSGVSQTLLSAKATPPKQSNAHAFFIFLFIVFLVAFLFNLGNAGPMIILALLAGASAMISIKLHQDGQARFERAMEIYANLRMCTRCGTFFNGLKRA